MTDFMELLAAPFAACILIAVLHCYMGLHVVKRGVIFVDLALAQMAALGAAIALFLGPVLDIQPHHHEDIRYALSLFLAFFGAVILALGRLRDERVPHEAIIGIVFVVSSALCVLVLSKAPHGHEKMEAMLVGSILFVNWRDVLNILLLYLPLGILHFAVRRVLIKISEDTRKAEATGIRVRAWDLLFYISFGLMVTQSVSIAGVLVVFSYLIIPAACAIMLVNGFFFSLLVAWGIALGVSFSGLALSAWKDLPTGPSLVATFGAVLILCISIRPFLGRIFHRTSGLRSL